MKTKDNSRFHPEGRFSQSLKSLFVTGMAQDVLNEMEQPEDKPIVVNKNIEKATICEQTNFFKKGLYVKICLSGVTYSAFQKMRYGNPIILTRINLG